MTEHTRTIDWATASPGSPAPLLVPDLLSDASTLTGLLEQALGEKQWLDAFLLAAGLTQLIEDRLHGDPMQLSRTASYLRGRPGRLTRLAGSAAGTGEATLRCLTGPAHRRLARALDALTPLTDALADHVLGCAQHGDLTGALPALGAVGRGPRRRQRPVARLLPRLRPASGRRQVAGG